jgi:hypothetical protein
MYFEAAFSRLDDPHCWLARLTFGPKPLEPKIQALGSVRGSFAAC